MSIQLRPRFNVQLRDDKSFPYILITADHWAPQILKHRGARNRDGKYYGPFASVWAVNRTVNALQRAFLLRWVGTPDDRRMRCLLRGPLDQGPQAFRPRGVHHQGLGRAALQCPRGLG